MNRIIPIGLMIVLATTGCTGPGGLFGDDEKNEEPFLYDLTIEDLWTDIPENMTSASDIINMTYELEKSPRVTNFTEIGYREYRPLHLVVSLISGWMTLVLQQWILQCVHPLDRDSPLSIR